MIKRISYDLIKWFRELVMILLVSLVESSDSAIHTVMQNVLTSLSRMNTKRKQRIWSLNKEYEVEYWICIEYDRLLSK